MDLAARNILLSNDLVAKIADFGISQVLIGQNYFKLEEVHIVSINNCPLNYPIIICSEILCKGIHSIKIDSPGMLN